MFLRGNTNNFEILQLGNNRIIWPSSSFLVDMRVIIEWLLLLFFIDAVKNGLFFFLEDLFRLPNELILPFIDGADVILDFCDEVVGNMLEFCLLEISVLILGEHY